MAEAPLAAQVLVGKYNKSIEEEVNRAGVLFSEMSCRLSKRVNAENIVSYQDNLGQIWGSACGLNRGIFTLAKYPGKTFNCGKLPEDWNAPNGVSDLFKPGRDMIADLGYLDDYMGGVFNTTAGIGPSSCAFQNLAHLWCGEKRFMPWRRTPWASRLGHKPLRGVNLGGLFVLEPWICPGFADWGDEIRDQYTYCKNESVSLSTKTNKLKDHWASFYSEDDFKLMSKYGINTARMPVGWWYFAEATGLDPLHYITPDNDIMVDMDHPITKVISWAYKHNIQIILDLHGAPGSQNGLDNSGIRSMDPDAERWGDNWFFSEDFREMTVMTLKTMTHYINMLNKNGLSNVIMLELMNEPWVFGDMSVVRDFYVDAVTEIRKINNTLPILVCDAFRHDEWHWLLRRRGFSFENIYMDTHLYHAFNPSDVASDNPHDDMMKQITASDMACGYGSLLRYKTCSSLPTMTGEWSLAIDDCMKFLTGSTSSANQFTDFGQCKNLKERNTPQWTALIKDFAARQRAVFEKELGWVFWTWKVDKEASKDISAPLWSYSMAVEAGYFPDNLNTEADVTKGCDHPVDLTKVVLPPPVTN
uniref:glucan 1,3-beta-glucosidase n=1 Tax=Lotharella oceanica TaxID=641309 RepID=A0A7S2XF99_9EUKA|eukprot:CAMPEP_0170197316 /NCGR_PEP_ID=MMETSP0040_2-20121228/66088_1 /TAXON_ID=641309 /ORGANISM="Lotharella oceanica, Strain CCMP622" /LENGTH=586 /DNA_ID=CAMNT_0010446959 /DNA_START=138 /DNA_END=1898 /DNA_ORIENTATION=+